MKIKAFRKSLSSLASAQAAVGNAQSAMRLQGLADALAIADDVDVGLLELQPTTSANTEMNALRDELRAFAPFVKQISKRSFFEAFTLFNDRLADASGMSIRDFIASLHQKYAAPVNENGDASLADSYVRRLKEALHSTDNFSSVFDELRDDKRLARAEVVEIASRFAFRLAKSTTKKEALAKIWKQHEASESSGAKSRATNGKTAA